jgi:hypothetical protein
MTKQTGGDGGGLLGKPPPLRGDSTQLVPADSFVVLECE